MTKGSDSRMARTTVGSFSPKAWVAMRAPMSRKRYGWPAWSRSRTARYGPTDSPGSKATGSEKKRLCEADSSAACDAGRYCWTSSSSVRSLSCKASGTYTCISSERYRALSWVTRSRNPVTLETAMSNVFMGTPRPFRKSFKQGLSLFIIGPTIQRLSVGYPGSRSRLRSLWGEIHDEACLAEFLSNACRFADWDERNPGQQVVPEQYRLSER